MKNTPLKIPPVKGRPVILHWVGKKPLDVVRGISRPS